jgi:GNAT superfamily N-acetyltransferase
MPSIITPTLLTCSCGISKTIKCLANRDYSNWRCHSCAIKAKWADPEYKKKKTENAIKSWQDTTYRQLQEDKRKKLRKPKRKKLTASELKQFQSEHSKRLWQQPAYRAKIAAYNAKRIAASKAVMSDSKFLERWRTAEYRRLMSKISKRTWQSQEYREKQKAGLEARWQDKSFRQKILAAKSTPEFKAKMLAIQSDPEYIKKLQNALAALPKVSKLQEALYSILDDLGIEYYREHNDKPDDEQCTIGPWSFDCVIPRQDGRTLLIECNGDFIHRLPAKRIADKAKSTYIKKYHSNTHELKTVWEHEFACKERVVGNLRYWLGLNKPELVDFEFSQIVIKHCPASDYKPLLQKYHYLQTGGRGGIAYGAYFTGQLIAVCVFSPLGRQNIDVVDQTARDLSRLCIHPNYQKQNFASWFVSRCIKQLPRSYHTIIAYCDTTFNHNGAIYKALNFTIDKIVRPDYWYRSSDGWVMHKKTLYNRAVNLSLREAEYAEKFGFTKVFGSEKIRFSYQR